MLAKALANQFKAKLLLLDVNAFSLKVTMDATLFFLDYLFWQLNLYFIIFNSLQMQSKYGCAKREVVCSLCFKEEYACFYSWMSDP